MDQVAENDPARRGVLPEKTGGNHYVAEVGDLFSDLAINDPYAFFEGLHRAGPILWNDHHRIWTVTGYEEISSILCQPDVFSSEVIRNVDTPFPPIEANDLALYQFVQNYIGAQLDEQDGMAHARMRHAMQSHFTPRAIAKLQTSICDIVSELIDDIQTDNTVDFKEVFALPLPIRIITALLGIPRDCQQYVRTMASKVLLSSQSESDRLVHQAEGIRGLFELIVPLVEERERCATGDLISSMVAACRAGCFTRHEMFVNTAMLVVSGHETTVNLLCNGLLNFARHPGEWVRLNHDPDLLARSAVEECLRFDPPVKSIQRIVAKDVSICGRTLRKGERLRCFLSAANRDSKVFYDPNRFNIARESNKHVAFGLGRHHCLGASLARLEAQESFKALAFRFSRLSLADKNLDYRRSISHRSLGALKVHF